MEIADNNTNNEVFTMHRKHRTTCSRILADGTRKVYNTTRTYVPKTDRVVITDELRQKIIADYEFGLQKTKIAKKYNITPYRVSKIVD
jgi:Mor family transcriptional regulator